tara:strand:- start:154 stop:339 length:186 start_codon:yes stop_codon:yes gene_type:complete
MKEKEKYIIEDKIENFVKWYREDCTDPYGEMEFLIKRLLETEHKNDIMDLLNDTYELYKNN